jgi:two-component system, chemotaxis family, CheB/CheR fusion protein
LGHAITVRSRLGKGSVFAVEMPLALPRTGPMHEPGERRKPDAPPRQGAILVIEDDPTLRETLELTFAREGHRTAAAATGQEALALVRGTGFRPDLVVSDYVLPGGMNGLQVAVSVREIIGSIVPFVFLTGDIRSTSSHAIAESGSVRLTKPVKPAELLRVVQQVLAASREASKEVAVTPPAELGEAGAPATIFVIDDDRSVRGAMHELLATAGYRVATFASGDAFLAANRADGKGCVITDVRMPGMSGFELLARLAAADGALPAIVITGHGDVAMAVEAMRAGAFDFIEKPVRPDELRACIDRALRHAASSSERSSMSAAAAMRIAGLTRREREVMDCVVAGHANNEIAARLGIAQRTVETHRATVMKKMGAPSLSELVRLVISVRGADPPSESAFDSTIG